MVATLKAPTTSFTVHGIAMIDNNIYLMREGTSRIGRRSTEIAVLDAAIFSYDDQSSSLDPFARQPIHTDTARHARHATLRRSSCGASASGGVN